MAVIGTAEILVKANSASLVTDVTRDAGKAGAAASKAINTAVTNGFKSSAGAAGSAAAAITKPYLDAAGQLREANGRFAGEATKAAFAAANAQAGSFNPDIDRGALTTKFAVAGRSAGNAFAAGVESEVSSTRGLFDSVLSRANGVGSALRAIARPAGLIAGAVAAGAGLLAGIGIKTAASLEQAQVGFDALLGSAEAGRAFFQDLIALANVSAFEVGQITGPAQTLLAVFPNNAPAATAALKTVVDAVALLGKNSPEALQRLTDGFGKAASQGKFQAESLNIIGEAIPGFSARLELARAIAVKYGIDQAAATKRIESGMVSAAEGTELLLDRLRAFPGLAGAALAQSKTLGGVLSTFSDTVKSALAFNLAGPLIAPLKEALIGLTEPIGAALGSIGTGIAPVITRIVPQIVTGLQTAFATAPTVVIPLVNAISRAVGALTGALPRAIAATRAVFNAFAAPVRAVIAIFGEAFPRSLNRARTGFGPITTALLGIARVLAIVAPPLAQATAAVVRFSLAIPVLGDNLQRLAVPALVALTLALAGVSAPVAGVIGGLVLLGRGIERLAANRRVADEFGRLGRVISDSFDTIRLTFGRARQVIEAGFKTAGFGAFGDTVGVKLPSFIDILVGAIGIAVTVVDGMATAISNVAAVVAPVIATLAVEVGAFVTTNGPAISATLDSIGVALDKVGTFGKNALDGVGPFIDKVAANQGAMDALAVVLPAIASGLATLLVVNQVQSGFSAAVTAVNGLTAALTALKLAAISNPVGLAIAAVVALGVAVFIAYKKFEPFRNVINAIGRFIKDNLIPVLVTLGTTLLLGPIIGGLVAGFIALYRNVAGFRNLVQSVVSFFTGTVGRIPALFGQVREAVAGVISSVVDFVGPILSRLGDAASGVADALIRALTPFVNWVRENIIPTVRAAIEFVVALVDRVSSIAQGLASAIATAVSIVAAVVGGIAEVLAPVVSIIARGLGAIAVAIGRVLIPALRLIARVAAEAFGVLVDVIAPVLRVIGTVFATGFRVVVVVVERVFATLKGIIEAALQIIRGIFQVFTGILSGDWGKLWEGIKNIVGGIFKGLGTIVENGLRLIVGLFGVILRGAIDVVGIILSGLLDLFISLPGRIARVIASGFTLVVEALSAAMRLLGDLLGLAIEGLVVVFVSLPILIVKGLVAFGQLVWDGLKVGFDFITGLVGAAIDGLVGFFTALPGRIVEGVKDFGTLVWDGLKIGVDFIKTSFSTALDGIVEFFKALPGRIVEGFKTIGETMKSVGEAILQGIIDGISGAAGKFADIGKAIANGAIRIINSAIEGLNNALEFKVKVPLGPDFTVNAPDIPPIPELANGAVVLPRRGGTLARIAEAGRAEAVLPLDKLATLLQNARLDAAATAGEAAPLIGGDFIVQGQSQPEKSAIHIARELQAARWRGGLP